MVSQIQPCPSSQSQSLLSGAEASLRFCSRRKLSYSNRNPSSAVDQRASEDTIETDLNRGESLWAAEVSQQERRHISIIWQLIWIWTYAVLFFQEHKEVQMKVITWIKSGKGKKELLWWRCQTCPRVRKSILRLHPADQRRWTSS